MSRSCPPDCHSMPRTFSRSKISMGICRIHTYGEPIQDCLWSHKAPFRATSPRVDCNAFWLRSTASNALCVGSYHRRRFRVQPQASRHPLLLPTSHCAEIPPRPRQSTTWMQTLPAVGCPSGVCSNHNAASSRFAELRFQFPSLLMAAAPTYMHLFSDILVLFYFVRSTGRRARA